MKLNLDEHTLDIPCPGCGQKITQSIGRLKHDPKLTCGACGAHVTVDAAQLRAGIARVQKSMDELAATMGKLFKGH